MSSVQVTGIPNDVWLVFRRQCLDEGVSANRKLRQLIEAQVVKAKKEQTTQQKGTNK